MREEAPSQEKILRHLKRQSGRFVSAETLAEILGTTPNCVRVLVYKLRRRINGTDDVIESSINRWHSGYRIVKRKT
jgi:biotin operon repressor